MSFSSDPALLSNQLPISIDFPLDPSLLRNTLTESYKREVNAINSKISGLFTLVESANFNQYYSASPNIFRSGYRRVFDLVQLNGGNIPASATVTINNVASSVVELTDLYGAATTTGNKKFGINYPYVYIQGNNLVFVNPEATPLTQCRIVMDYLKE